MITAEIQHMWLASAVPCRINLHCAAAKEKHICQINVNFCKHQTGAEGCTFSCSQSQQRPNPAGYEFWELDSYRYRRQIRIMIYKRLCCHHHNKRISHSALLATNKINDIFLLLKQLIVNHFLFIYKLITQRIVLALLIKLLFFLRQNVQCIRTCFPIFFPNNLSSCVHVNTVCESQRFRACSPSLQPYWHVSQI